MPFQRPWLLIGVSARIYYPAGPVLDLGGVWTKTLHYLEQSVAHWVMRGGALPVMVPAVDADSIVKRSEIELAHYAEALDGLVLQGGNDLAPEGYGETPLKPEWAGDRVRDRYEMELVQAFMAAGKPVFGICRGFQLLNVMHGGTLLQDIPTQRPDSRAHRDGPSYERHFHDIEIVEGSRLAQLYPGDAPQQGEQHPPPGHQGPGARLRHRGALPGRRHDRSHPPPRPRLPGRRAVAPRVPRHRARHLRRRRAAGRIPGCGARHPKRLICPR